VLSLICERKPLKKKVATLIENLSTQVLFMTVAVEDAKSAHQRH